MYYNNVKCLNGPNVDRILVVCMLTCIQSSDRNGVSYVTLSFVVMVSLAEYQAKNIMIM